MDAVTTRAMRLSVPPKTVKAAVIQELGRLCKIELKKRRVALQQEGNPHNLSFPRIWIYPRLILNLSAGRKALDLSLSTVFESMPLSIDSNTVLEP